MDWDRLPSKLKRVGFTSLTECEAPQPAYGTCCIYSCAICANRGGKLMRRVVTFLLRKAMSESVTCRTFCSVAAGWGEQMARCSSITVLPTREFMWLRARLSGWLIT